MDKLIPIEREGVRVLLTSQLAEAYETTERRISENFNRHSERYIMGKHYFLLEGEDKREFLNYTQIADGLKNAAKLYLWTEKGALLHAKSLNTDKAWEVYDHLVDTYFRVRQVDLSLLESIQKDFSLRIASIQENMARQSAEIKKLEIKLEEAQKAAARNPQTWRDDCFHMLNLVAEKRRIPYEEVLKESFERLEGCCHTRLKTRLRNLQSRTGNFNINEFDVIAEDLRLYRCYRDIIDSYHVY